MPPAAPARILDVGGGPGTHSARLAADGYEVELVDPVPLHARQAERAAAVAAWPFTVRLGDARHLSASDRSADAVLLLGPLYTSTPMVDSRHSRTRSGSCGATVLSSLRRLRGSPRCPTDCAKGGC